MTLHLIYQIGFLIAVGAYVGCLIGACVCPARFRWFVDRFLGGV